MIGASLLAEILFGLGVWAAAPDTVQAFDRAGPAGDDIDNTRAIGRVLYTQYFYLFQVAGLVLLVAMIGAIVLTLRAAPGVRRQRDRRSALPRRRTRPSPWSRSRRGEGV